MDLWLQVWHQPREYYPVRAEHRDGSHRRPGIALRVCRRGSALSTNFRHESGLSRHKENVLLRCVPQVSLPQSALLLTSDLFFYFNIPLLFCSLVGASTYSDCSAANGKGPLSLIPVQLLFSRVCFYTFKAVLIQIKTHLSSF